MDIIPVIDIKGGLVVRASGGDRAGYQPIETPLANGSDPVSVARGLVALAKFKTLYVADLDGIEGRGRSDAVIAALEDALPDLDLWVDNGIASLRDARAQLEASRARAVIGSETLSGSAALLELLTNVPDRIALSLDFRGEFFVGPADVLADEHLWPECVIVMTLGRVGSDAGPDLARLKDMVARAGAGRRVYAAGGVRNLADIKAAHQAGAAGALIATALHAKKFSAGDLEKIAGR